MTPTSEGPGGGPADARAHDASTRRLPYLPALDGLRTLALLAVLLDHGGVALAAGGHFGVTVFFVLSGFLVTALLLQERHATGRIHLRAFWGRRARRLVPATLAFFAFTLAYLVLGGDNPPSTVVGDGLASLAWLANWRFVLSDRSYGDLFADPTPFAHLWSLAVEEQFYLGLPLVAAAVLGRRRGGSRLRFGLLLAGITAAASAWMWVQYVPGTDPLRLYYGTDTRIAELAVGALLAVVLVRRDRLAELAPRLQQAAGVGGGLALAAIGLAVTRYDANDAFTYRGGLLAVAGLAAIVVLASTQPRSLVARALAVDPLPQLGRLTYGAYLFHWPLFLWLDEEATGLVDGRLLVVRLVATFGLAFLSHELLERPVRLGAIPRPVGGLAWANVSVALAALLVVVAGAALPAGESSVFASGVGPTPVAPPPEGPTKQATASGAGVPSTAPARQAPARQPGPGSAAPAAPGGAVTTPRAAPPPAGPAALPGGTTTSTAPAQPAASAMRVAVVGDSLAANFSTGLSRLATTRPDLVVYDLATPGCPISRGGTRRFPDGTELPVKEHCRWWEDPDDERTRNLRAFDPDIVLVEDALNEIVDRKLPEWSDYRGVGDPRFDTWLLGEYREAAKVFAADGALVVYANAPCADWSAQSHYDSLDDADERVDALNRIYDNVVAATTRVADLFERLCPHGRYTSSVEGVSGGRPDGFHLSDEAAFRLADRWLEPFLRSASDAAAPEF